MHVIESVRHIQLPYGIS